MPASAGYNTPPNTLWRRCNADTAHALNFKQCPLGTLVRDSCPPTSRAHLRVHGSATATKYLIPGGLPISKRDNAISAGRFSCYISARIKGGRVFVLVLVGL